MLNEKDNQVFIDYLAGGQSTKIAEERSANATSSGVLSVAARNLQGVEEKIDTPSVEDKPSPALGGGNGGVIELIKATSNETAKLVENMVDVVTLMTAQTNMSAKLHEQNLKRKQEMHELDMMHKRQMLELDMMHKRQMLELRAEEARAEEAFARARQMVVQAENLASLSPAPPAPDPTTTTDYCCILGRCQIPQMLQQLDTLFAGVSESLQLQLNNIRLTAYEGTVKDSLTYLDQRFNEAMVDSGSPNYHTKNAKVSREKLRDRLSASVGHVRHYCHLVFWTLLKTHLAPEKLQGVLGESFSLAHQNTTCNSQYVTWSNVDEKKFGLPVDLDNVPAAAMDSEKWNHAYMMAVEKKARRWADDDARVNVYGKNQRRTTLWLFKSLVVEKLCEAVQKELLANI